MHSWARRAGFGSSNDSPWRSSIDLRVLVPSPSVNRPPESRCSVAAVMASVAGVRE